MIPDCKSLKGKRDYAILALLVGCGLKRKELASLDVEDIQRREDCWVIIDLCGKEAASAPWRCRYEARGLTPG